MTHRLGDVPLPKLSKEDQVLGGKNIPDVPILAFRRTNLWPLDEGPRVTETVDAIGIELNGRDDQGPKNRFGISFENQSLQQQWRAAVFLRQAVRQQYCPGWSDADN